MVRIIANKRKVVITLSGPFVETALDVGCAADFEEDGGGGFGCCCCCWSISGGGRGGKVSDHIARSTGVGVWSGGGGGRR